MARDPLVTLARLRRLAVDEARRALAARLEDEADADGEEQERNRGRCQPEP